MQCGHVKGASKQYHKKYVLVPFKQRTKYLRKIHNNYSFKDLFF